MFNKLFIVLLILSFLLFSKFFFFNDSNETIKVGVLHSNTGTMAISEQSVIDATMFAIDEINQNGGLLGKKVKPVFIDGASKPSVFYAGALKLITEDKVDVVFGCWTSACRKTVKPLFEEYNHLLIYPIQYEGLETSSNIFYTGMTPNQQVLPALHWALEHMGKKVYLLGSDYIYPRAANAYIKDMLSSMNIKLQGEAYLPSNAVTISSIVNDIRQKAPDFIINTIKGETNLHFFKALQEAGVSTEDIPVLSFSLTENEYRSFIDNSIKLKGHYTSVSYLFSDQKKADLDFADRFHHYTKKETPITDPMLSAYIGVNLWANAVRESSSSNPVIIKDTILRQRFEGPNGIIYSDKKQRKLFRRIHLGKVDETAKIHKVWEYNKPIPPITFPYYRSKEEWKTFLDELFDQYDQKWTCRP